MSSLTVEPLQFKHTGLTKRAIKQAIDHAVRYHQAQDLKRARALARAREYRRRLRLVENADEIVRMEDKLKMQRGRVLTLEMEISDLHLQKKDLREGLEIMRAKFDELGYREGPLNYRLEKALHDIRGRLDRMTTKHAAEQTQRQKALKRLQSRIMELEAEQDRKKQKESSTDESATAAQEQEPSKAAKK